MPGVDNAVDRGPRATGPLPPDCGVWMYGPSGTFESEQTALGQQHYGVGMHVKNLPGNWTSSANDLEVTAFMLDGVLFVVDHRMGTHPGVH